MIHLTGKFILKFSFVAVLWLMASAAVANLSVTVDRTEISDADLLKLTIRIENATTATAPDFRALERDFEIVQRSGPNQSSRISIINGRQTSEVYVSWELRLRPKRLGTLTIPAFRLGSDTSDRIDIQVSRQSEAMKRKMSQLVFFDTSVDTNKTYVQGQIIYTIKLYYVENISGDFPPVPNIPDAVVETIESEKRYDAITNGRRYYVLEKSYGIYPQKSGELTIPAQTFSGYRVASGFFSTREPILTRSKAHTVTVDARPAEFTGDHWLPATNVTLKENWIGGPPSFTVGEPVNRSIEISATGVAASLLPPLPDTNIEGAKTYQDPPAEEQTLTPEGIAATQTIVIGIVPTRPGNLTLPEISIPWWNTATDQLEIARIPAQSFEVAPSPRGQTAAPETRVSAPTPASTPVQPQVATENVYWQYIAIGMSILWLLTLAAWIMSRRQRSEFQEEKATPQSTSVDTIKKQLKRACSKGDVKATQGLLIQWGQSRYSSIDSLQSLTRAAASEDLTDAIADLEQAFYAPNASGNWQGKSLWQAVEKIEREKPAAARRSHLTASLNPG